MYFSSRENPFVAWVVWVTGSLLQRRKYAVGRLCLRRFSFEVRYKNVLQVGNAFSRHSQMVILPRSEFRFFTKVFFRDVKSAHIADLSVYDGDFSMIPRIQPVKEIGEARLVGEKNVHTALFQAGERFFLHLHRAYPVDQQSYAYAGFRFILQHLQKFKADVIVLHNIKHDMHRRFGLADVIQQPLTQVFSIMNQFNIAFLL